MINKKKKVIALSVVALVLASLVVFGLTTYAWIDDVKLVEFNNDDLANNSAPLKTGTDINAAVNITKGENTVDLGNMLTNEDITYEYTEDGQTKRHIKYDITAQEKAYIDKNKGYFYESGGMHLSPCYSDGETFYFQRQGQNDYREGNKDDENVNYISFTTKVSSPDATVDFWFDSMPTIQGKGASGTVDVSSFARYAIIVDGECHVYSSSGTANTCNAGLTGTTAVAGVRKTSNYTYGDNTNTTAERGANSNTLFSIKKGGTVNMTVKIWLEGGVSDSVTTSNINLKLVSSWAYKRTIRIVDKTTSPDDGVSWLNHHNATLYVTIPEYLSEIFSSVDDWVDPDSTNLTDDFIPIYKISDNPQSITDTDGTYNYYEISLPLVFNNEEIILYRCNASGWNNSSSDASERSSYNVHCWNWWRSITPNTYGFETFTLYGSSMDQTANTTFGTTITNKGYGTWGKVDKISVYSHYTVSGTYTDESTYSTGTDWATCNNHNYKLFVRDYSDESTSQEIYTYTMYRANDNQNTPWVVFIPASSSKIQFTHYYNNAIQGQWGYDTWNHNCPQQRPVKSDLYSSNSTVYHFTANDSGDSNKTQGRGFWEGANLCYVIKAGWLWQSTIHDYMWWQNSNNKKVENSTLANAPEVTATKDASNVNNIYYQTSSQVFNTEAIYPRGYKDIIFSNGDQGDDDKTNNLVLFAGCFYLPGDERTKGKWLGSLNDTGRAVVEEPTNSGNENTGTDAGGGSMDGFTTSTTFIFKINGTEYPVMTNGSTYKVRLPLSAGDNWVTVQKKEGNYPEYGNGEPGKYFVAKEGMDLFLSTTNSNNFSIRTTSSGDFIVAFQNENQDTIKITSILKEGS